MWSEKARRSLKKLPSIVSKKIILAVREMQTSLGSLDIKRLRGFPYHRLRVGDYRVIFQIDKGVLLILILEVGHRNKIYRKFK